MALASRCATSSPSRPAPSTTRWRARSSAELPKTLGQPVIVENRPGGNTIIGTELAAKSPPDGYTLYGAALPFSVIQSLYKTSFDVTKDFAPITLAGVTPNLLVANPDAPVNSVQGADRVREGQSRQAELRLDRQRHLEPPVVRAVQGDDRHPGHAHPVQGQRAGGDRPHRRPGAGDVRQHAERAAARARRQAEGARRVVEGAQRRSRPRCRPSTRPACRATTWASGSAC